MQGRTRAAAAGIRWSWMSLASKKSRSILVPALMDGAPHAPLPINNLLVVNNYRDRKTDQKVRKNTSVVLLGKNFGLALYFCGFLIPCVLCPLIDNRLGLVTILFPFGLYLVFRLIRAKQKCDYSFLLSSSAVSVLLFGILTAWSLVR